MSSWQNGKARVKQSALETHGEQVCESAPPQCGVALFGSQPVLSLQSTHVSFLASSNSSHSSPAAHAPSSLGVHWTHGPTSTSVRSHAGVVGRCAGHRFAPSSGSQGEQMLVSQTGLLGSLQSSATWPAVHSTQVLLTQRGSPGSVQSGSVMHVGTQVWSGAHVGVAGVSAQSVLLLHATHTWLGTSHTGVAGVTAQSGSESHSPQRPLERQTR